MIRIRGGSGLGDSIYLRPIAEYLLARGNNVTALTKFPEVFIGSGVNVDSFNKSSANLIAHYVTHRQRQTTTQYQDMLDAAGIAAKVPLRFAWNVRNAKLVAGLRKEARGRRLVLVHGGRAPFGRTDGFGMRLMPQQSGFEMVLAALGDCFTVRVGNAPHEYALPVSRDLNGETTVSDVLDLGVSCDGVVGQCSFAIPLAEVFVKPFLGVWSARGLRGDYLTDVVRTMTPQKMLTRPTSRYVVDDWPADQVRDVARQMFEPQELAA